MTINQSPFSLKELTKKVEAILLPCETVEAFEEVAFGLRSTDRLTRETCAIKHAMKKTYKAALKNKHPDIAFAVLQETTPYYTGEIEAVEVSKVIDLFVLQENRHKALAAADWYLGIQDTYGVPIEARHHDNSKISMYRSQIYNNEVRCDAGQKFLTVLQQFNENNQLGSLQKSIEQNKLKPQP